jgi:hypothetical protein
VPSIISPSRVWRGARCVEAQLYARPSLSADIHVCDGVVHLTSFNAASGHAHCIDLP